MPSLRAKVQQYEQFLHLLQMNAEVTMNSEHVRKLIARACNWSYAHRRGNGELSERQQNKIVNEAFAKLNDLS